MLKHCKWVTIPFLFVSTTVFADSQNALIVEKNDGEIHSYLLSEQPKITYEVDKFVVHSNVEVKYDLSDINQYRFQKVGQNGLDVAKADEKNLIITYQDNQHVSISGLADKSLVGLFNSSGQLIKNVQMGENGTETITLPSAAGVYVLKVNGQTIKVIKK